jgi:hypothetical protein
MQCPTCGAPTCPNAERNWDEFNVSVVYEWENILRSLKAAIESIREMGHYEDYCEASEAMQKTGWYEDAVALLQRLDNGGKQ